MAQYHLYEADISPYAQRVVIQLEIKNLSFTREHPPGGFNSEEYGLINPIRRLPVIRLANGGFLPESEVICEYIEDVHPEPSLRPEDPIARANGRLISRITDLYIMNPMMPLFKNLSRATRDPEVVDLALAQIDKGLTALDRWISPSAYANADRLTLADLAVAPVLRYVQQYPPIFGMTEPFARHANVAAYMEACRADEHIERGLTRIEAGWEAMRAKRH